MNGQDFLRVTREAFVPFLMKLGFKMDAPAISGRFYRVSFTGLNHAVSVSYEPGDETLFVMVFSRKNGRLSDIDNRSETPRLADLNERYMPMVSKEERAASVDFFKSIAVKDKEERHLLQAAKELRLVLPKYLPFPRSADNNILGQSKN